MPPRPFRPKLARRLDDWRTNDRIRRQGTGALAQCAGRVGARLYIQQSILAVAAPRDGSPFDEDTPPRPGPIEQSAFDGERLAQELAIRHDFKVCILRCGWFYGADSAHTRTFGRELARRRFPIVGAGDAIWPCLHVDDAAGSFVATAEADRAGLWHVLDNEPVTLGDFLREFASLLGAKPPRSIPEWLARLVVGKSTVAFLTRSMRTTAERFHRDIGWQPRYPSYREGLAQIVAEWNGRPPK